ncbi:putative toxin-antitoxin system toxin component, PIN family [Ramlibacter sp. AN1015]|uniref:putative toxin-antitoxin system toxin component, PIN family n=1 Tax=Ramlibacter sp. AN1015 TaxID=3133428 RepID=UPI0030BEE5AA
MSTGVEPRANVVIDTNVVLDAFVFGDAQAQPLLEGLRQQRLRWLATEAMRSELVRVLDYACIAARLDAGASDAAEVLRRFDAAATLVPPPAKAAPTCADPDDQKFVDLAVAFGATLLSKDRAVLALRRRLAPWSVTVVAALPACAAEPAASTGPAHYPGATQHAAPTQHDGRAERAKFVQPAHSAHGPQV